MIQKNFQQRFIKSNMCMYFPFSVQNMFFPEMLLDFFSTRGISSKLDKQRN